MKYLALTLTLVLLSSTFSSAGHRGWSWGWWMPKPPTAWEKPERPERPEKPERPDLRHPKAKHRKDQSVPKNQKHLKAKKVKYLEMVICQNS